MSHLGGAGASGVLGFMLPLPVLPDWSKEMGPAFPFWTCPLPPDSCNPCGKGAVPGCIWAGCLWSQSAASYIKALFFFLHFLREREHILSVQRIIVNRHKNTSRTQPYSRGLKANKPYLFRNRCCRAESLTGLWIQPREAGNWMLSPCQPGHMESVIRKQMVTFTNTIILAACRGFSKNKPQREPDFDVLNAFFYAEMTLKCPLMWGSSWPGSEYQINSSSK